MTLIPGKQVAGALHALKPSFKFENTGSTAPVFSNPGTGEGGDGGGWAFVPNGFFTMAISPNLSFGLALNAPFGLKTEYENGWRGQLKALKSEIVSVNINPSVAYKVSDTVSIGGGVSVQYLEATLTKAANAAGTNIAELNADDIGYGFNLGLMIQATPNIRIGASYRSAIKYELEGTVAFSATPLGNGGVKADLKVPDSASLSIFETVGNWELMGDLTWTGWSTLQRFDAIRTTGAQAGTIVDFETFNWKDVWRYSIGANYKMSPQTKFRFGLAFDETPTNDVDRTPRLPDEDRTWIAFGLQYKPSKTSILDVGYAHEFIKDAKINNTIAGAGSLIGTFKNKADIFSVQYSQSF